MSPRRQRQQQRQRKPSSPAEAPANETSSPDNRVAQLRNAAGPQRGVVGLMLRCVGDAAAASPALVRRLVASNDAFCGMPPAAGDSSMAGLARALLETRDAFREGDTDLALVPLVFLEGIDERLTRMTRALSERGVVERLLRGAPSVSDAMLQVLLDIDVILNSTSAGGPDRELGRLLKTARDYFRAHGTGLAVVPHASLARLQRDAARGRAGDRGDDATSRELSDALEAARRERDEARAGVEAARAGVQAARAEFEAARAELEAVRRPRAQWVCHGCLSVGAWKKCDGCSRARFCSQECLAANWRAHRPACRAARREREAAAGAAAAAAGGVGAEAAPEEIASYSR